jgi:hypothetical protein
LTPEPSQLINSVIGAAGTPISGITQQIIIQSDRDYYFAVEILDSNYQHILDTPLEPGANYLARVKASLNEVAGLSITRKIAVQATLVLEAPAACIDIHTPKFVLEAGKPLALTGQFEFTVHADCALPSFPLELRFFETSLPSQSAVVTSRDLTVNIRGLTVTVARHVLGIRLEDVPPDRTIFCYVSRKDNEKLTVNFYFPGERPRDFLIDRFAPDNLAGDRESPDKYAQELYGAASEYFSSRAAASILQWLWPKLPPNGEPLDLILIDETDSLIPWELATFAQNTHLAARVRFSRWLRLHYFDQDSFLSFKEVTLDGHALAMFDHPGQPFADLVGLIEDDELFDALRINSPVSLVYIGGESLVHCSRSECSMLRSFWYPSQKDVEIRFGLGAVPPTRPIFIATSPHSGWVVRKNDQVLGLPRSLLQKAGSAVIGALGPISSENASTIVGQLLEAAMSDEGLWPAEALRTLRKQAEREIAASQITVDRQERLDLRRRALAKLLFVYYGAPNLRIRFSSRAGG